MASSKRRVVMLLVAGAVLCVAVTASAAGLMMGPGGGHAPAGPGYLGIMFHDVNDSEIGKMGLKDGHGAEIIMVDHDGPAGKAGLREHDVVLSMNGTTIDGEDQLRRMLHDVQPGKTISLAICRDGVERTVTATTSTKQEVVQQAKQQHWIVPEPEDSSSQEQVSTSTAPRSSAGGFGHSFMSNRLYSLLPTYTGATVDPVGAQLADYFGVKDGKGLLVHAVDADSPAASAGLHAGDVIVKMNGGRVATEKDWTRALHESKGRPVAMTVIREKHEQVLTMVPDAKKRSAVEEPVVPSSSRLPVMMLR